MKKVSYAPLDFANTVEVLMAAQIHENAPLNWDPGFVVDRKRLQWRADFLRKAATDPSIFIVTARDPSHSIIGLHWLRLISKDGELFDHIDSLWVAESCRGDGIGRELKRLGEEWAKANGAKFLSTEVFYSNSKMIEFNLNLGFKARQVEMIKEL